MSPTKGGANYESFYWPLHYTCLPLWANSDVRGQKLKREDFTHSQTFIVFLELKLFFVLHNVWRQTDLMEIQNQRSTQKDWEICILQNTIKPTRELCIQLPSLQSSPLTLRHAIDAALGREWGKVNVSFVRVCVYFLVGYWWMVAGLGLGDSAGQPWSQSEWGMRLARPRAQLEMPSFRSSLLHSSSSYILHTGLGHL